MSSKKNKATAIKEKILEKELEINCSCHDIYGKYSHIYPCNKCEKKKKVDDDTCVFIQDYVIPDSEKDQLRNLIIELQHDVPPQHSVSKKITKALKAGEKEKFNATATMKTGPYSPYEDDVIIENWESFCKIHHWDVENAKPFTIVKHKGYYILGPENRLKFMQFIANGLDQRTIQSVYLRFQNIYSGYKTNEFSVEEDQIILLHMENVDPTKNHKKFAEISKVLNRKRIHVWRRYQSLTKQPKQKR